MAKMTPNDKEWLEEKYGQRANFRLTARRLYGHDIAAIPKLVRPLIIQSWDILVFLYILTKTRKILKKFCALVKFFHF